MHSETPWTVEDAWIIGTGTDAENCGDNFERALACVNAFHGSDIPTEKICEGVVTKTIEDLRIVLGGVQTAPREGIEQQLRFILSRLGHD